MTDVSYFLDLDTSLYLLDRHVLCHFDYDMVFVWTDICANLLRREEITAQLQQTCRPSARHETISLATHEQYSFPYYRNYIPDHFERLEAALRCVTDQGYAPVFFHDGLLGNPSDGKGRCP